MLQQATSNPSLFEAISCSFSRSEGKAKGLLASLQYHLESRRKWAWRPLTQILILAVLADAMAYRVS